MSWLYDLLYMFYNQESEPWPGLCVGENFSHSWIYQVEYSFEEFYRLRLDASISMKLYLNFFFLLPRNISRQKAWLKILFISPYSFKRGTEGGREWCSKCTSTWQGNVNPNVTYFVALPENKLFL